MFTIRMNLSVGFEASCSCLYGIQINKTDVLGCDVVSGIRDNERQQFLHFLLTAMWKRANIPGNRTLGKRKAHTQEISEIVFKGRHDCMS